MRENQWRTAYDDGEKGRQVDIEGHCMIDLINMEHNGQELRKAFFNNLQIKLLSTNLVFLS
jgi:hypothetical protein